MRVITKQHLFFSSAFLLTVGLSFLPMATFAEVKDWANGDETAGREVCGVISKFWDARFTKAAQNEDVRHYELLTDEVIQNGIDWSKAREVAEGIHVIYYKVEPESHPSSFRAGKKQKFYLARVDLSQPGVRLTGPGRCNHWNQLMIDTTSQGYRCATLREKTTDLMARCRGDRADGGRAKDMRLAFNACAWGPWSDGKDQSSAFAQVNWPLMFDGIRVDRNVADGTWGAGSSNQNSPYNNFVFYKDGTAGWKRTLTEQASKDVWVCIPNFGNILVTDGVVTGSPGQADAQRTNIGLSQDGRYFYVSVSDGRKADEWASGPDYYECGVVQKAMGAYGAIALDGGGSSTLATWDSENSMIVVENCHGARRNGSNCGVYFYSVLKQDDSDYVDIDDYVGYGLAAGDVATIVRDSVLTVTNGFPASCTVKGQRPGVTFGWGRKVSPTVLPGTRVCFTNITFAADSRTLTVKAGGTAAVASDVLDKVVTADASGFELAGTLTSDVTVDCAGADADGNAFGTTSVAAPDTATLLHIRHPSNRALCATATSGGQLVWRRYVTYSSVVVTPGYDFTNAVVTATVSAFAGHIDGTYALRLTITDRHSHAVVLSKPVTGPGAYVFDTAEAESQEYLTGYGFDFTLELVDGDGSVVADEVTVNGALNFANRTSWFAASAANDSETNGAWDAKPLIEGGSYMIGEADKAAFLAAAARGGDVIIGTTASFFGAFDRAGLDSRLADYAALSPLGVLTICEDPGTGANVWCALVKGSDGQPVWKYLYGRPATPTVSYRVAEEIDFSGGAPYVSYLVAAPDDAEPVRLKDAGGAVWFDGIGSQTQATGRLLYDGEISVADIEAEHLDKSVAEVDGTRYATFGAAAAAGGSVTLLTNVSWTPDASGTWQIADGGFDLRLYPGDLTAEYRDGQLVVSGGIVVPSRFPVNGSATVTAVVSDEFIRKHFPGSDISTRAGFDAVLAGLNAKRTEGNGLTLLESYILGLDPDDATAVPQATISYDAAGGRFVIALGDRVKVNESADVGVRYALRSADNVGFTDAAETEPGAERTFTFEPRDAAKKFFTIRISFSENEQR